MDSETSVGLVLQSYRLPIIHIFGAVSVRGVRVRGGLPLMQEARTKNRDQNTTKRGPPAGNLDASFGVCPFFVE